MGRTLRAPILKLGVNCMAAISNEKVSCTDVCIAAGGCCGLAIGGAGALVTGAVGVRVVSGMIAGDVVCGNTGSVEAAFGESVGKVAALESTGVGITAGTVWAGTGCARLIEPIAG